MNAESLRGLYHYALLSVMPIIMISVGVFELLAAPLRGLYVFVTGRIEFASEDNIYHWTNDNTSCGTVVAHHAFAEVAGHVDLNWKGRFREMGKLVGGGLLVGVFCCCVGGYETLQLLLSFFRRQKRMTP